MERIDRNDSLSTAPEAARGSAQWVKPAVVRLSAGSAEDGAASTPDGVPGQPS